MEELSKVVTKTSQDSFFPNPMQKVLVHQELSQVFGPKYVQLGKQLVSHVIQGHPEMVECS